MSGGTIIEFPNKDTDEQVLAKVQATNQEALKAMTQLGMGLNPADVLHIRVEMLVDNLLGHGSGRTKYELAFEQQMAEILQEGIRQAHAQKLTGGVAQAAKALHLP